MEKAVAVAEPKAHLQAGHHQEPRYDPRRRGRAIVNSGDQDPEPNRTDEVLMCEQTVGVLVIL